MTNTDCLKCGGTGMLVDGTPCDCGCANETFTLPSTLNVPLQYQNVKYDMTLIRKELQPTLGVFMERLLKECTLGLHSFSSNYVICAPPNSGKTIWAYTLYSLMYSKGQPVPKLMDIMEVREALLNFYFEDKDLVELINKSKIMVIKLPLDLPSKFPETMSMIIERRVRNNCFTIFLYNGSKYDLVAQDKFGKLKYLIGDGSYNSVNIKSFEIGG